jgi:hypothetical protein
MITLFSRPQFSPRGGSASVVVSVLAHAAGFGWLFFGLTHTPRIIRNSTLRHFTVRVLDAPLTAPEPQQSAASGGAHPLPQSVAPTHPSAADTAQSTPALTAPGESPAASMPTPASQLKQLVHQSQTLIQPDAPPNVVLLRKTPIPTVFMWAPSSAPIKPIIESPQQKSIVATLRPLPQPPNHEVNLADIKMSSTPFATTLHSLLPSTTSPIAVRGPDPVKLMPQTSTPLAPQPTPVRILSLSDLQAQGGPIAIPLANASASPSTSQSVSAGHAENSTDAGHSGSAETGHPSPANKQTGAGPGQNSGTAPAPNSVAPGQNSGAPGSKPGSAEQNPAKPGLNPGNPGQNSSAPAGKAPAGNGTAVQTAANTNTAPGQGSDAGSALDPASVSRITLPRDGQFGVVVVGSALAEQYPETVGLWSGRPVYTVYLHVGAGKSWILQYSLPPAAQAAPTANGARPDAPWPYDIVRPRFDPDDFTSDALMVHGFVNAAGHFERLALVFPSDFAKSKFLLSALQQWEFRPARQNGQVAAVEVLLIIPEETE